MTPAPLTPSKLPQPSVPYRANSFSLSLYESWQDKTVFTITGPVETGIQHNLVITVEEETQFESLRDYAEWQINIMENELKACRMLKREEIKLTNGMPAYRAIFSWYPTDELRVYQEQMYVLHEKTAYRMTATFTKKTRKTLGPLVEQMMLSFTPVKSPVESSDQKVQRR